MVKIICDFCGKEAGPASHNVELPYIWLDEQKVAGLKVEYKKFDICPACICKTINMRSNYWKVKFWIDESGKPIESWKN